MAKPKLALIPSAQGSKFYSVLPSSGVGDFDFTRSGSATRINSQGLIETVGNGVSRLNYPLLDGKVVGCPSHILEPERTNLLTYSEGFVTDWNNTNITINSNSIISPDGSLNGTKFIPNTTSGQHYIDRNGVTVNSNAAASIFAKKGEYKKFAIRSYFTGANAIFDVNEGIIISTSSVTAKIENYGNGWYRCSLNETLNANYGYGIFVMEDDSNNSLDNYSGNGIDGMYFYGASLEIGSYSTSYIPTTTTAVTRSAETANGSGDADTFNDSEGVLMAEISALANDNTNRFISLSSGQYQNRVAIFFDATNNNINIQIRSNDVNQPIVGEFNNYNIKEFNKILIKYKKNDVDIYINGFLLSHNTNCNMAVGLSEIAFDDGGGLSDLYGNTKQIQYYDSALTDSELETLTSWVSFQEMAEGQLYSVE
jgi:hypothetical protein